METLTSPPPITTTTTVATAVKTPDPESEPPQSTVTKQPIPPSPFTNGVLKRHKPLNHHHHHHQEPPHSVLPIYKECLKNHAASIGGHAIDGCGEFMPSPTSSPSYPTSLKCAACGCHRNFHRREQEEPIYQHLIEYQPHHRHHPPPPLQPPQTTVTSPGNSPSPPPISSSYYPSAPHMLLALSTGLSAPPPETHNFPAIPTTPGHTTSSGKKRFRTKFTQLQKEKMMEIAEQVGWKMQKRDEELITGFCNEIGVDRNVFKVWMHNNKSSNKKDFVTNTADGTNLNTNNNVPIDFIISRNHNHNHDHNDNSGINHHHHHLNGGGGGGGGGDITSTGHHDNNLMLRSITKGSTSSS